VFPMTVAVAVVVCLYRPNVSVSERVWVTVALVFCSLTRVLQLEASWIHFSMAACLGMIACQLFLGLIRLFRGEINRHDCRGVIVVFKPGRRGVDVDAAVDVVAE